MNEELKKYYDYLKVSKADVPDTYESFAETLSDEAQAKTYFDYLKANKFDTPDTYDSFAETFSLKKKSISPLGLASEGQTALQDLGLPSKEPITPKLPYQSPKVNYEETLPETITPTSVMKSNVSKGKFLEQKQVELSDKITTDFEKESDKLRSDYEKKLSQEGANKKQLEEEYKVRVDDLKLRKSKEAENEWDKLVDSDNYEYLAPDDVKGLGKEIDKVLSQPMPFDKRETSLNAIRDNFLSKVSILPADIQNTIKREINEVFAKKTLFDEKGDITPYGWKKEASQKLNEIQGAKNRTQNDFIKKYPDFYEQMTPTPSGAVRQGFSPSIDADPTKRQQFYADYEQYKKDLTLLGVAEEKLGNVMQTNEGSGSFADAFKMGGRDLLAAVSSVGWSDVAKALENNALSQKVQKGEKLSEGERALFDTYGIFDAYQQGMTGGGYKLGNVFAQSIPMMESIASLNVMGILGGAGTATLKQIAKKEGIKKLLTKEGAKLLGKEALNLGGAMAKGAPLTPQSWIRQQGGLAGQKVLNDKGEWTIDKATVEGKVEATIKGLATGGTELGSEILGGYMGEFGQVLSKIPGLENIKLPKVIGQMAKTAGVQGAPTEIAEEFINMLWQAPIGDQPLSEITAQDIWDTIWTTAGLTTILGSVAIPSGIMNTIQRNRNYDIVRIAGRENISALRSAIENKDQGAFNDAIEQLKRSDLTTDQINGALTYAKSIATEVVAKDNMPTTTDKGTATTEVGALEVPQEVADQKAAEDKKAEQLKAIEDLMASEKTDEPAGTITPLETKDGRDWYNVVKEDGQRQTFGVPEGSTQDVVDAKSKEFLAPQKAPFVEINTENISEIENNTISSLREKGATEEEVVERQKNIDLIKQSVNERSSREKNPDTVGEYGEDASSGISEIRPEEIAGNDGQVGRVYEQRRTGNRSPRVSVEEQVANQVAPNGEKSNLSPENHAFVRTPEFKAKFGDWQSGEGSLVLDRNGEPLLVYSGKGQYHIEGLDPSVTETKTLHFTGSKNLAMLYAWIKGKQPVVYRGFISVNEKDLTEGKNEINVLHDNQQEFKITNKSQFIPVGIEEVPKRKRKVKTTQSKDSTIPTQTESKEAITAPITEEQVEVPPPTKEPPKVAENASKEEKQREKGYYKRLNESSVPSNDLKDEIKEKGLTYTVLNNNVTRANVDYLISELGLEEAWKQTKDKNSTLNGASRSGISERLVVHYDKLATEAEKEGNLEDEKLYREKALEIAEWKDEYGRDAGQFNQYSGSDESTALLSPKSNVVRVKKSITKQRNKKIQENKTDIREKRDAMREANKESVSDVISSKQYEDLKKRIAELERKIAERDAEKPPKTTTTEKIKSEKQFRDKKWSEITELNKKRKEFNKSGSMGLTATNPYTEQIVRLAGDIFRSYIKEGAYKTEDLINRFKKEWFKKTGDLITDKEAQEYFPKEIDGKPTEEILAENENKALSDKLVERVKRLLEDPKTPKNDPAKQLIDTLFAKIEEKDTREKVKPPKKSDVDKIREAIENKEQYADTWEESKQEVIFMIDTNEDLSEDQKSDQKKRLQSFFEEVIGKPFAEKQVTGAIKDKIKELDINLDKVVKQHYTVQDATGRTLAQKLVDELGLTEETADEFAKVVQKQFDKIATERKKKILLNGIKARARALTNPKQTKLEWQKLIELTNLGAFSSAEFSEAYAEIWGFPKLSEEQTKEIERLAGVIQQREGFKKDEAVRDYLNYLANLPGIDLGEVMMGWWYASILSGQRTQAKNFLGNLVNTIFEAAIGTTYNVGKGDFKTAQAMWTGLLNAGDEAWTEAKYTFATGYSPVRFNKIEAAQTLERWKLKGGWMNPVNSAKYIGRFMSATDAFFYVGLREMRAHELAMREAKKINAEAFRPSTEDWAKADEILFGTALRKAEAEIQAKDEGLTGTAFKKRVFELMEKSRGEGIVTESNNFASRGTYNYRPEGGIGMITEAIGRIAESGKAKIPNPFTGKSYTVTYGKFIVPFTRIIANVANTSLDYTPIGAVRAFKGSIKTGREERREYTSEDKSRLLIKATIGTATSALLYLLSEPPDDDSEPVIQITANGTGDYAKNQELKGTPNGWQQYSIKVGGTWYSYQYTPLFLVLAPMGFLRDTQNYKKDKALEMKALDIFAGLLSVSMSSLSDITALTTVSDLMGAISSGDLSEFQRFWKKMASSTAKGFIYPKAIEQSKQMIADFNDSPNTYSSSFLGKMVKDMPGMKNYFPVQFNQFGEPVTFDAVQMLEKPSTTDPVAKYVADNEAFIGTPNQKDKFCIIYDDKLGVERAMNDNEYMLFVQTSGREIKNRILDELMPRTDLTTDDIKKEITNIKSEVRKQTKAVLFGWNNVRKDYPSDWNKMVETSAVPVPTEMVEVKVDDKKVRLDDKQLDEFNEKAINYYREYVIEYLRNTETVNADKSDIDEETGSSYFNGYIKKDWANAKADAKADFEEKLNKK